MIDEGNKPTHNAMMCVVPAERIVRQRGTGYVKNLFRYKDNKLSRYRIAVAYWGIREYAFPLAGNIAN
jgi:hypothetical protein